VVTAVANARLDRTNREDHGVTEPLNFDRSAMRVSVLRMLATVVGLGSLYALLPLTGRRWWLGLVVGLGAVIGVLPLTVKHTRRVLSSSRPLFEAIEALVALVATFVLGFSIIYVEVNRRAGQFTNLHTKLDAVYFATATLTTVGFGDISASGQAARAFVTAQMAIDVVILAVMVKALTGAARRRREYLGDTDRV